MTAFGIRARLVTTGEVMHVESIDAWFMNVVHNSDANRIATALARNSFV